MNYNLDTLIGIQRGCISLAVRNAGMDRLQTWGYKPLLKAKIVEEDISGEGKKKEERTLKSKTAVKYNEEFGLYPKCSTVRTHGGFLNKGMMGFGLHFTKTILDALW